MNTTPPDTHQTPPRAPWRFARREHGKMVAGVATGMADAFHIDVLVVRVIWVVVAVASFGLGIAAYAICWIAFPSDRHPAPLTGIRHRDHEHNVGFIAGLALLGLGLVIVFGQAMPPFRHGGSLVWATVLIGGGLAILVLRHPDDELPNLPPPGPGTTTATDPPSPPRPGAATPPATDKPPADQPAAGDSTAWTQHMQWPTPPTPPSPPPWVRPPWPPHPPRRPRRRSFLTPLTLSVLLIGAGLVVLLDNAGTAHITVAEALAAGVALIGVALVASAWFGRARGLIPIGIVLLIVAIPAATIDVPITGGIGHRDYRPATRSELRSRYEFGIGRLEVDLLDEQLVGHTTHVNARLGIGELVIDVPTSVRVVVHGHAGAGSVSVFGDANNGGWPENVTRTAPGTQSGVLYLDARVGAGHIEVHRYQPDGFETLLGGKFQ